MGKFTISSSIFKTLSIEDVKKMPIDLVVSSKNIVEFRNKMNLCKELLPKSSSLFTQISRL